MGRTVRALSPGPIRRCRSDARDWTTARIAVTSAGTAQLLYLRRKWDGGNTKSPRPWTSLPLRIIRPISSGMTEPLAAIVTSFQYNRASNVSAYKWCDLCARLLTIATPSMLTVRLELFKVEENPTNAHIRLVISCCLTVRQLPSSLPRAHEACASYTTGFSRSGGRWTSSGARPGPRSRCSSSSRDTRLSSSSASCCGVSSTSP